MNHAGIGSSEILTRDTSHHNHFQTRLVCSVCVLNLVGAQSAKNQAVKHVVGMSGAGRDIKVQIHWLLVQLEVDFAGRCDRDLEV